MNSIFIRVKILVLILFVLIGCGRSHKEKVLKEFPYSKGVVEIVCPIDWEMTVPIQFKIKHKGETIFYSSTIGYVLPKKEEVEIIADYKVIDAFNCILLIKTVDGKSVACGFYALDLMDGYPKQGMLETGYYEKIKKRWNTFCTEKGVSYQLYDFPKDIQ